MGLSAGGGELSMGGALSDGQKKFSEKKPKIFQMTGEKAESLYL